MNQVSKLCLAVLISGSGRTLKNFLELASTGALPVDIRLVISSSPTATGLQYAKDADIPTAIFNRREYPLGQAGHKAYSRDIFDLCRRQNVDYVAMAGFLKLLLIPNDYKNHVLNIHPSLIPAFCGQGMFGLHVHQAVIDSGIKESGCTVHFVDNEYDHGPIIWQQAISITPEDTADTLADRVFATELQVYPYVLRLLAEGNITIVDQVVQIT